MIERISVAERKVIRAGATGCNDHAEGVTVKIDQDNAIEQPGPSCFYSAGPLSHGSKSRGNRSAT